MVRNEVKQVIDFAQDLNAETFDYSRIGYENNGQIIWPISYGPYDMDHMILD